MNGSLALGVLPVSRYQSGHTAWAQRLHEVQRLTPLAVHPTFTCACVGRPRRRTRFCTRTSCGVDATPVTAPCSFACAVGGNMGKKARLRDSMLMDDPPSYWTGK